MSKKVLITGGAGFIGSALSKHLQEEGHEVFVLDNLSFGKRALAGVPDDRFFNADIRDRAAAQKVLDETRPNIVLHLAAIHFTPYCNQHPAEAADININGTINVLESAGTKGSFSAFSALGRFSVISAVRRSPLPRTSVRMFS